ncbi:MAG TPA: DUF4412 domain-containing protein [Gemmatimonadaceae bacterium]|nr:DUF4412 domain-containing protein [Gemmatimonadaceae bacterium]
MGSSFIRTSIYGAVLAIAASAAPAVAHGQGTKQFQGVVTFQTEGGQTFQYAVRQGLVRIDMNGESRHGAMIMDPASHKMYMLMPEQKTYMEMTLSGEDEVDDSATSVEPTKTGKTEVVAGHKCEYWTVKEDKGQVDVCLARDMGGFMAFNNRAIGRATAWQGAIGKDSFPLKVVMHKDEGEEVALVATKVEPKTLDASLFAPPSSYKKMEMNMKMPGTPR